MKVVVDRGIVYLMGIVTPTEAAMTKKLVAGIEGVRQVVALYSIESEDMIRLRLNHDNQTKSQNTSTEGTQF